MASSAPSFTQAPLSRRKAKFALAGLFVTTAAVWFGSRTLLSTNFLPHWYCYVGNRHLLWTNVIADMVIGLSYVVISATLVWLVRRTERDLPYSHFFWAFGLFIVSCGATHFMEVLTVWKPVYWLSAVVKIMTAAASAGTAVVLLIAADDIIDFVRGAREAAARRESEQFRRLINASPMAVLSVGLQGKITAWNPAAESLFGLRGDVADEDFVSLAPREKRQEQAALLSKTLAGEVTVGMETFHQDRHGQSIPVSISTAPLFDDQSIVAGAVAFIENISERKRIAQELEALEQDQKILESQVRQAQKMEVLGRLAGGVAHDFNNMLMVLGGCTELLDRSLPGDSPSRHYLDQIQRTVEKAAAMTRATAHLQPKTGSGTPSDGLARDAQGIGIHAAASAGPGHSSHIPRRRYEGRHPVISIANRTGHRQPGN